jgi:hypothetical protein
MSMKSTAGFINHWEDNESKERILKSGKGIDLQKAEVENHLKDMAMRFERSPNPTTIKLWASDIVDAGFNDLMVREICGTIPKKFEKHPTLAQIFELLRPYLPQIGVLEDELDKYTRLAIPHLKAKFVAMVGQEAFERMIVYYETNVFKGSIPAEICVLGDWCRSYMGKPEKIIEQGIISNQKAAENDREYFIRPLKLYCIQNKLAS